MAVAIRIGRREVVAGLLTADLWYFQRGCGCLWWLDRLGLATTIKSCHQTAIAITCARAAVSEHVGHPHGDSIFDVGRHVAMDNTSLGVHCFDGVVCLPSDGDFLARLKVFSSHEAEMIVGTVGDDGLDLGVRSTAATNISEHGTLLAGVDVDRELRVEEDERFGMA